MKDKIQELIRFLKKEAGDGDMASVQINSSGRIIFRIGLSYEKYLTVDEFLAILEEGA